MMTRFPHFRLTCEALVLSCYTLSLREDEGMTMERAVAAHVAVCKEPGCSVRAKNPRAEAKP
jgi:hypothetical protein